MDAGDMVKSITDLDDGYEIAFASGKTVEVSGGVTRVKIGEDGTIGASGTDGTTLHIGDNDNWYIDGVNTGVEARSEDGDTRIISIVDNGALGMVTITMNDDANMQYTFRKASTAAGLAVLVADVVDIAPDASEAIPFTVNPANATVSTTYNNSDIAGCD